MKSPYKWDNYSDQPALLQDKNFKKKMRKKEFFSLLKTFIIALFILPFSIVAMPFIKRKEIKSSDFFCLGIDYQKEPKLTLELIEELNIDRILVRLKLWDMESLDSLKIFLESLSNKKVTLKIMQDRENIEDHALLKNNLQNIFTTLHGLIDMYEIGTTINRSKWGIFSVDEYNKFYQTAYNLQQEEFTDIKLIGSGVIDFEYHFTAHTLFNFFKYKYNAVSSLLYVDRRGAPENTQIGFSLSDKIALLSTLVWLSPKTKHELHITETNYPLSNTAPFAPTSEHECIDEDEYANFMLRYYFLSFASQQVDSVSWHQLFARGYGLIDNIDGIRYTPAYSSYKYMIQNLKNAQFLRLDIERGYHILQILVDEKLIQIHWSLQPTTLKNEDYFSCYTRSGEPIQDNDISIGSTPVYIFILKSESKQINCL